MRWRVCSPVGADLRTSCPGRDLRADDVGNDAVQIVHWSHPGSRSIENLGSAHDEVEAEALKAVARQRLAAGQGELDFGLAAAVRSGGPLQITSSGMGQLWDALCWASDALASSPRLVVMRCSGR